VALRGENFDGHDFVAEAVRRGAGALLCSRPVDAAVPVLLVADTLRRARGLLGRFNRSLFTGTVVALTGSAGKTTTKEMIAAILGRAGGPCWPRPATSTTRSACRSRCSHCIRRCATR
jgi:UDP-N-acetylmuramoyl-tripeptide--D-alanyl-D-alanine ligase